MAKLKESLKKWKEMAEANPFNYEATYNVGLIYMNMNLRDAAITWLRKATEISPEEATGHFNLAVVLLNNGEGADLAIAKKEMQEVLTLEPDNIEANAYQQFCDGMDAMRTSAKKAFELFKKAIEICPDVPLFYTKLGQFILDNKATIIEAQDAFKDRIHIMILIQKELLPLYFTLGRMGYLDGYIKFFEAFAQSGIPGGSVEQKMEQIDWDFIESIDGHNSDKAKIYYWYTKVQEACLPESQDPDWASYGKKALELEPNNLEYIMYAKVLASRPSQEQSQQILEEYRKDEAEKKEKIKNQLARKSILKTILAAFIFVQLGAAVWCLKTFSKGSSPFLFWALIITAFFTLGAWGQTKNSIKEAKKNL